MDTHAAAQAWIEGWRRGWADRDADAIGALYAANSLYLSHPFREPETSAREYALRAFADEELIEARFDDPIVHGDRAAIEYWALLNEAGELMTLAGVSLLRFDGEGLVVEHRDFWAMAEGHQDPPAAMEGS